MWQNGHVAFCFKQPTLRRLVTKTIIVRAATARWQRLGVFRRHSGKEKNYVR